MPISAEELVRLLAILAEEENMKVTVKETLKGGAMAGAGAVIGGMCGGPMGLAVGGAVGGAFGAWMTKGKFKSVPEILLTFNQYQRDSLYNHFRASFEGMEAQDFDKLSRLVTESASMRGLVMDSLRGFFNEQMRMQVVD
ncbi:protein C19orf12 homolog isoform X2 [Lytechinus pictus]|uniref:protein C19orf12 homolog isoform X2 n=1 Tax=Lytechinus pictus TaxID=7653 RepID=UPI0030B9B700